MKLDWIHDIIVYLAHLHYEKSPPHEEVYLHPIYIYIYIRNNISKS